MGHPLVTTSFAETLWNLRHRFSHPRPPFPGSAAPGVAQEHTTTPETGHNPGSQHGPEHEHTTGPETQRSGDETNGPNASAGGSFPSSSHSNTQEQAGEMPAPNENVNGGESPPDLQEEASSSEGESSSSSSGGDESDDEVGSDPFVATEEFPAPYTLAVGDIPEAVSDFPSPEGYTFYRARSGNRTYDNGYGFGGYFDILFGVHRGIRIFPRSECHFDSRHPRYLKFLLYDRNTCTVLFPFPLKFPPPYTNASESGTKIVFVGPQVISVVPWVLLPLAYKVA
jgi:hypothetical protein